MTILYFTGFDLFADSVEFQQSGNIVRRASGTGLSVITSAPTPRTGTRCLRINGVNAGWRFGVTTPRNEFIVGWAFQYDGGDTLENTMLLELFSSANGTGQLWLGMNVSGQFFVARGHTTEGIDSGANTPTTLLWTDTEVQPVDTWMYLEFHAFFHDTTGSWTLKKNEALVQAQTDVDTKNGSADTADWIRFCGGVNLFQDDVYLMDPTVAPNDSFLGDRRCRLRMPTGDSTPITMTPSSGSSHFAMVDEVPNTTDTDYNGADTVSEEDRFTYDDLPSTVALISALKVTSRWRKDDAGGCSLRNKLKSGATTVSGVTYNPGTTYTYESDTYETDPNTGAAWARTPANDVITGVERTA